MATKRKTPPLTFAAWLKQAKAGEQLTYHISDKQPDDRLFIAASLASDEDKVILFQKRVGPRLHYIAQRLSPKAVRFLKWVGRRQIHQPQLQEAFS